jgi:hypothetical protein
MTILFTMTIDTEEEWDWDSHWPTANLSLSNIYLLPQFQELCERHGVSTTYFANRAVFDSAPGRDILLALADRPNVEIGMHIHPWNTPPLTNSGHVRSRETYLHNLDNSAIREKLESVYGCFRSAGMAPISFRGGRYSSGGIIHEFLQDNHFIADVSICPYSSWPDDGAPDYRDRGLQPTRIAPRRVGQSPLWEIPLTLAFSRRPFRLWRRWYDLVERSWLSKLRLIGIGERLGIVRKVWLNFESPLGEHMESLLRHLQNAPLPAICFTVHSSSLMPGGNAFTRTESDSDRLFARLDRVFRWLRNKPIFQPATVSQVAKHLEAAHHARIGN